MEASKGTAASVVSLYYKGMRASKNYCPRLFLKERRSRGKISCFLCLWRAGSLAFSEPGM